MALWHYKFFILPKDTYSEEINIDGDSCFDDSIYWFRCGLKCDFFDSFNVILPKSASWSEKLLIYGDKNSTTLEVFCERGIILSVNLNIDYTSRYDFILSEVIEFCIFNRFLILDNDLNILPLNLESIKTRIDSSIQLKKYNKLSDQE